MGSRRSWRAGVGGASSTSAQRRKGRISAEWAFDLLRTLYEALRQALTLYGECLVVHRQVLWLFAAEGPVVAIQPLPAEAGASPRVVVASSNGDLALLDLDRRRVVDHHSLETDGLTYYVNGTPYTATDPVRVDSDGDGYFVEVDPDDGDAGVTPAPNGGCAPLYQYCDGCYVEPGQVVINEILPAPSSGYEWVELYNTTNGPINIGNCYIDDVAGGGGNPYQIPAGTIIPAGGFWTLDRSRYFNNGGDDVRFLKEDATTVLDAYTYGATDYDVSWYRSPDGGAWQPEPTAFPTKGASNVPQ